MVESRPIAVNSRAPRGRFVYVTGCDGTGKSTQARLLLSALAARGRRAGHLWLRFPFLLSLPLLAYARWRGYSWQERHGDVSHGYWSFRRSRLLRALLPWTLLADAVIAALHKIYIPLSLGRTIVCERFALDMLVDLAVACEDAGLHRRLPGRLYPRLLPRGTVVTVLDLDPETARERRPDLRTDRRLDARMAMFRRLAADLALPVFSSHMPVAELRRHIWDAIGEEDES